MKKIQFSTLLVLCMFFNFMQAMELRVVVDAITPELANAMLLESLTTNQDRNVVNRLDIVNYALEHGADPNVPDDDITPLLHAVNLGDANIVVSLLRAGALVNIRNHQGLSPFLLAAMQGRIGIMQGLYQSSPDFDIQAVDASGKNALMLFSESLRRVHQVAIDADTVTELLRWGIDINARDAQDKTALDGAADMNNEARVQALLHWNDVAVSLDRDYFLLDLQIVKNTLQRLEREFPSFEQISIRFGLGNIEKKLRVIELLRDYVFEKEQNYVLK